MPFSKNSKTFHKWTDYSLFAGLIAIKLIEVFRLMDGDADIRIGYLQGFNILFKRSGTEVPIRRGFFQSSISCRIGYFKSNLADLIEPSAQFNLCLNIFYRCAAIIIHDHQFITILYDCLQRFFPIDGIHPIRDTQAQPDSERSCAAVGLRNQIQILWRFNFTIRIVPLGIYCIFRSNGALIPLQTA